MYLSESNSFSYVIQGSKVPSRFIKEIEDDFIDHVDDIPKPHRSLIFDEEVRPERNREKPKDNVYRNGDIVIHKIYGEGVVIKVNI